MVRIVHQWMQQQKQMELASQLQETTAKGATGNPFVHRIENELQANGRDRIVGKLQQRMDLLSQVDNITSQPERMRVTGGAGAPLRDHTGSLLTDLRRRIDLGIYASPSQPSITATDASLSTLASVLPKEVMPEYDPFNPKSYRKKLEQAMSALQRQSIEDDDPAEYFLKFRDMGGCGAPRKDRHGHVVTTRKQQVEYDYVASQAPSRASPTFLRQPESQKNSKEELYDTWRQQIEDKKRRQELEVKQQQELELKLQRKWNRELQNEKYYVMKRNAALVENGLLDPEAMLQDNRRPDNGDQQEQQQQDRVELGLSMDVGGSGDIESRLMAQAAEVEESPYRTEAMTSPVNKRWAEETNVASSQAPHAHHVTNPKQVEKVFKNVKPKNVQSGLPVASKPSSKESLKTKPTATTVLKKFVPKQLTLTSKKAPAPQRTAAKPAAATDTITSQSKRPISRDRSLAIRELEKFQKQLEMERMDLAVQVKAIQNKRRLHDYVQSHY